MGKTRIGLSRAATASSLLGSENSLDSPMGSVDYSIPKNNLFSVSPRKINSKIHKIQSKKKPQKLVH